MKTQRPLRELAKVIIQEVSIIQKNQTIYEQKLLNLYEGQLQKYVEESIRAELEPKAAARAIERILPINMLPKIINKASDSYAEPVVRSILEDNDFDTDTMGFYEKAYNLDTTMLKANKMLNLFKYCALEPYISEGKPKLRVLNPTEFTVWSDDPKDKTNPTVFIKFMGKADALVSRTDTLGNMTLGAQEKVEEKTDLFYLYSEDEFIIVDREGNIRQEIMLSIGNEEGINSYGEIPFIYINSSDNMLIPLPSSDMFTMTIQMPKLLSDLAYAVKFQSHSITYAIDIDSGELEGNPDSFWDLKSVEGENKKPQLGTIKPDVDVDKVLNLINSSISLWLDSLGLKVSSNGAINKDTDASGIAKIIDEADTTSLKKQQQKLFRGVERELFELTNTLNTYWIKNESLEQKAFSSNFQSVTTYSEPKPYVDPKAEIEIVKAKLEANLTSYKRAVQQANPELTTEEIDDLIIEIKEESLEDFNNAKIFLDEEE